MSYVTAIIPANLSDEAALIGRAIDPDSGGDLSFSIKLRRDGQDYLATEFLCEEAYYQQVAYLLTVPPALHAYCVQDYAVRFPALTPPTLAQVAAFAAGAVVLPMSFQAAIAGDENGDGAYEWVRDEM